MRKYANAFIKGLKEDYGPVFAFHHKGARGLEIAPLPEGAAYLLDIGEAKDKLFGGVRAIVHRPGSDVDAVFFATDMWMARATPLGMKNAKELRGNKHVDRGFEKLVKMGWMERCECLMVTAQTEQEVLILRAVYKRNGARMEFEEPEEFVFPQAGFSGRQKMWGDLRPENLS